MTVVTQRRSDGEHRMKVTVRRLSCQQHAHHNLLRLVCVQGDRHHAETTSIRIERGRPAHSGSSPPVAQDRGMGGTIGRQTPRQSSRSTTVPSRRRKGLVSRSRSCLHRLVDSSADRPRHHSVFEHLHHVTRDSETHASIESHRVELDGITGFDRGDAAVAIVAVSGALT